ncbi:MAG: hypothetical protein V1489_00420 [Candidatus Liptonbacteria bacterium]
MFDIKRFILFLLILIAAIGIQLRSGQILGWNIDTVIAALLVFALWSQLAEQILLILLSIFLLNWHPGFSPEMIFFALYPLFFYLLHPYLPVRRRIAIPLTIMIGILGFYLLVAGTSVVAYNSFLWKDEAVSTAFGLFLFYLLQLIYEKRGGDRHGALYALPR